MVKPSIRLSGREIEKEVQRFKAFADSYSEFLEQFGQDRIFTEEPPEDSCGWVAAHLLEGRYLLKSFTYTIEKKACDKAVRHLADLFGSYLPVQSKDLAHLKEVFSSGKLDAHAFVTTVFRNRGDRFLEIIREHGLEEDLSTFFAVYLSRLFRMKAVGHLCEDITFFNFKDWQKGYCPVCGHWPAMAYVDSRDESRLLWCLNCGTTWPFGRYECIYCPNQDKGQLELIAPDDEQSFQVQACTSCREYLKELHSEVSVEKVPFDAYFLGTHAMDFFARGQGFVHESPLAIERDDTAMEAQLLTHRMRLPWDH